MGFDPGWVQAGELGFAFIVVILCAVLVRYTLRESAKREAKSVERENLLMGMLQEQRTYNEQWGSLMQDLIDKLEALEGVINDKLRAKQRRG